MKKAVSDNRDKLAAGMPCINFNKKVIEFIPSDQAFTEKL